MFTGCTNLTTVPAILPATTLASCCYDTMFSSCQNLTATPALPATILADSCYKSMFGYCGNLTTVPALPATTLADNCYKGMFQSCFKIKLSTTQTSDYITEYRVPYGTEMGIAATDALTDMFTNTGGTFKGTPTINTIYYTSNTLV